MFEVIVSDERFPSNLRKEKINLEDLIEKIRKYVLCLECNSVFFELSYGISKCWGCDAKYQYFDDNGETGGVLVIINEDENPIVIVSEDGDGSAVSIFCDAVGLEYDSFLHFWNV
jgi:hypothetical protein